MAISLIVRADASTLIGTGHVMRCLAIAQAWRERGGQVTFVTASDSMALEARLRAEGLDVVRLSAEPGSVEDVTLVVDVARRLGALWVIIDGYHFTSEYQRDIKDVGLRLLMIDDKGCAGHYYADLVLNQNLHADQGWYADREPYAQLLLGPRYVLLRQEFLRWQGLKREFPRAARNILVSLGGSDPKNATLKIVEALQQANLAADVLVVVGGTNPHYEELKSSISGSRLAVRLARHVNNMPELMAWSELAVTSGGTTVWELAFMGVPSVVGRIAEVEDLLVGGLNKHGLFIDAGWFDNLSGDEFSQMLISVAHDKKALGCMSIKGQRTVDGFGCERVLRKIEEHRQPQ